ncbi:MAG: hypothetical protein QQM50_01685 [Dehalococcoides mccartyi]|jgi:hypothetical protein|uniref:Uncharacterized protein n=2 Tax=root TaxID=1 RepID=A0AB38Z891_9CHLR|nr:MULTISPECIES: hypothetical protein [Dehalococcoides]MBF4482268.1 hypothetical protein [Dehalococcoides mccartyi]MBJ7531842.1 hypothetical protein [Dehalococcoides mccartyi]MDP4279250.1 hypothetical protein [Dehalococcoides mccartyi]MEA4878933.1 hypothetical protein [Dehalococcoides mccartyi]POZ59557.1 hypothetical protein C1O63_0100 [Dehalococcoides mccartyi]
MSTKLWMSIFAFFFIGQAISLIVEGTYIGTAEVDLLNSLTGYSIMEVSGGGGLDIPKIAGGFFLHGLPKMLMWDYSFFEGSWSIFRFALMFVVSGGVVIGLAMLFIGVVSNIVGSVMKIF